MNTINTIFGYYDTVTSHLSPAAQIVVAVFFLLLLLWQIFQIMKSGHWLFIAALIICLPGTWPASRYVGNLLLTVVKFFLIRIQANIG